MPVMEVDSKPGANTGQPAGTLPLMCAWGRNKTATVDFGESGTPRALFPKSDCLGIYVSVSSKPGFKTQPFSAFNSPILQNTQDAITYLNSQLSSIPGAPQFFFASPPSRSCIQIGIVPAAKEVLPPNSIATENNIRINFDQSLAPTIGLINLRNDEALNPNDYGAGPLLEHELLHALGLGHSGDAMGAPFMYSSTDIMSLTGTSNAGLTSAFIPLTADEKQALKEIYGTTPITLSASQREKFCKVIDPNATAAAAGGGTTGGTGIDPTPPSCSLSCQLPLVLDPDFMQLRVLADVEFVLP